MSGFATLFFDYAVESGIKVDFKIFRDTEESFSESDGCEVNSADSSREGSGLLIKYLSNTGAGLIVSPTFISDVEFCTTIFWDLPVKFLSSSC